MAMDSSSAQSRHQEMGSQTLESMLIPTKPQPEKKPKPAEQALKCPRCESTNTKFCYYNNYSLSQPRYFCKSCRRYWTKGGTLRNVPVGGGCRKTKRSSSSSSSKRNHDHQPITRSIPSPINPSYDSNVFASGAQLGLDDPGFPTSRNPYILETPLGFQSFYYGIGDGANLGPEVNGGIGVGIGGFNQEMGLIGFEEATSGATTTPTAATAVKQEICGDVVGREDGEISRGFWGFPWQNVGGDGNIGELDFTRIGSWNNGMGSTNWHGLLNSPLM